MEPILINICKDSGSILGRKLWNIFEQDTTDGDRRYRIKKEIGEDLLKNPLAINGNTEEIDNFVTKIRRELIEEDAALNWEFSPITYDEKEGMEIDTNLALAFLLREELVEVESPDSFGNILVLRCNDLFDWACAEVIYILPREIPQIYLSYLKEGFWGTQKWACKREKIRPQYPVEKEMKSIGIWDEEMEALKR